MTLPFRDVNLQAASDSYTFISPSSPNAQALSIDRPTGDIRLSDASLLSGRRITRVSGIAGILGMIQLRLDKYIILITKVAPVGRLKGHMVHKVLATELLPLRERQIRDPDEDRFLALLRAFISSGPMFFSYSLDITNSFQRQAQHDPAAPLWARADDRFFWNRFVQSDLIDFRTRGGRGQPAPQPGIDPYILPIIFGMFELDPTTFQATPVTLALISRRARHRGGTRYFTRGVDEDGHPANYNETEMVLVLNDRARSGLGGFGAGADAGPGSAKVVGGETQVLSYVQTRGSVPVYWAEVNDLKFKPRLQIRSLEAALPAARAHFEEQVRIYGDNYLVNLVDSKGREARVKQAYQQMVELLVSSPREKTQADPANGTDEKFHTIDAGARSTKPLLDRLHYVYFDYHNETKGMRLDRVQNLIDQQLRGALEAQRYFRAADMPGSGAASSFGNDGRLEVRSLQASVVRTNCMDCLDRTNVVQSMLARWALDRMFADVGLLSSTSQTFRDADPAFELLFRRVWADHADCVSAAYAGTGAMKTDVTRLGRRTIAGALRDGRISLTRYCKNNFFDGPRQDAFDLFLGAYRPADADGGSSSGGGSSGSGGGMQIFADRRPVPIQSVPYVAAFAVFFVLVGLLTPRLPDAAVWPMRLFLVGWIVVAAWGVRFVVSHGMLYVNWPKLNPRPWATEGYHDAISKVRKNRLLGPLVARHERGLSTARYLNAEEGKKRIE